MALDAQGRIRLINRKGCELLGRPESELVGRDWIHCCQPPSTSPEAIRQALRAALRNRIDGHAYSLSPVITSSGDTRIIAWHNRPQLDATGRAVGMLSTGVEIEARGEKALPQAEHALRLGALLHAGPVLLWAADAAKHCYFFSPAWLSFTGHSLEQARGLGWVEAIHPQDRQHCLSSFHDAFEQRSPLSLECRLRRHDGAYRWIQNMGRPSFDAEERLIGYVGCCVDITPARQARERHLQEEDRRRERLQLILDHAPIGIWMLSPSGTLELVNRTLCDAMGIAEADWLAADHYTDLIPAPFDAEQRASDARAMAASGARVTQERLPFADGRLHDLRVIKLAKRDATGRPVALFGLCMDITEELRDEAARHASKPELHRIADWTYDWEYWTTPDGRFCYMSRSAERFTGYSAAEFHADPGLLDAIVYPEDRRAWQAHLPLHAQTCRQDAVSELELRIVKKDGSVLWVSHRCHPVFGDAGDYQGRRVTVTDIQDRKEAEEHIRNLAYFDALTGLPNRRLLLDRLGQALAASSRSRRYGALLMLDLDHFKALNDTKGHDAGDRLLVEVAQRITHVLRELDTVSRLGGDEYVIMLEELSADVEKAAGEAELVAEKIRGALNAPYQVVAGEPPHHCTPSIGVALFRGHQESIETLLKQADVALYQAKDAGRNRVRFFSPAMQIAIEARLALEHALRRALREEELRLYFQPQIDQHGRYIGAEALVRWHSREQGTLIPPMQFIPLAEETGLILGLGQWVVREACQQLKAWEADPQTRELQLAVNVSARQLQQPDFVAQIRDSLAESGANPARLKLELTESAFLANTQQIDERMKQLRALGVSFSLDDFGTGFSSLSYLKRLPFDQLKIDQAFVRDVTTDPNDAAIVAAILAMSRSLGLEIIAEGVETEAQRDFLLENGCHGFQGYLFGRPAPIEDLAQVW